MTGNTGDILGRAESADVLGRAESAGVLGTAESADVLGTTESTDVLGSADVLCETVTAGLLTVLLLCDITWLDLVLWVPESKAASKREGAVTVGAAATGGVCDIFVFGTLV